MYGQDFSYKVKGFGDTQFEIVGYRTENGQKLAKIVESNKIAPPQSFPALWVPLDDCTKNYPDGRAVLD